MPNWLFWANIFPRTVALSFNSSHEGRGFAVIVALIAALLVLINRVAKVLIPLLLVKYIAGKHIAEVKQCEYLKVQRLTVDATMKFLCETDGEIELTAPVTIEKAPWHLNVMVPSDFGSEVT